MPNANRTQHIEKSEFVLITISSQDDPAELERRQHIESMLEKLPMTPTERQFVINTAEKLVEIVCEEYSRAIRINGINPECISAAATVASMIVYDG